MLVIEWCSRAVWCSHSFAIFFFLCLFVCYLFAIGNGSISMSCELLRMTFKILHATRNKRHLLPSYTINIQIVILFHGFFLVFFPAHASFDVIKSNETARYFRIKYFSGVFSQSVWNIGYWSDMLIPREFISFVFITYSQIVIPFSSLEKQ